MEFSIRWDRVQILALLSFSKSPLTHGSGASWDMNNECSTLRMTGGGEVKWGHAGMSGSS